MPPLPGVPRACSWSSSMNLSHYQLMDPHVNHGDCEKRVEAGDKTFPADNQAAVLPLEPGKRPLSLEARDVLLEGAPTRLLGVPDPFGHLRPDPAFPEAMAESLRGVSFIRREDLEPLARSAPFAVRMRQASNRGRTWARSSPFAGVVRVDNGMPAASVRRWMRMPLPGGK
jgi:hypothetical protein